jgi:hypothetical protein
MNIKMSILLQNPPLSNKLQNIYRRNPSPNSGGRISIRFPKIESVMLNFRTVCQKKGPIFLKDRGQRFDHIFQILTYVTKLEEVFVHESSWRKTSLCFWKFVSNSLGICIQKTCLKQEIRIPEKWGVKDPYNLSICDTCE